MKMGMLKRFGVISVAVVLAVVGCMTNAYAFNTVTVGSAEAVPGQTDLLIPIFVKNEQATRGLIVPLMIKDSLGGAYVVQVAMTIQDRIQPGSSLTQVQYKNHFNFGTSDVSTCKRYVDQPSGKGGFVQIPVDSASGKHTVGPEGKPYGVMFVNQRIFGDDFPPGADVIGTYHLILDLNDQPGCFVIDTACMDPANHLYYTSVDNTYIIPFFAKGVVISGDCSGAAMAAVDRGTMSPANGSHGLKTITFNWDVVDDAIAYEIEIDTVDATFTHIWSHRFAYLPPISVTIPGDTLNPMAVYWRVRATPPDCRYCFGPWSEPAQYTDVQTLSTGSVPDSYTLDQNYPNPFNASTVIQFTTKRDGNVKLDVYNILGQDVATLVNEFKPVGTYSVTWDGADSHGNVVPSGMYFYRVSTADFTAVKKMTLLK